MNSWKKEACLHSETADRKILVSDYGHRSGFYVWKRLGYASSTECVRCGAVLNRSDTAWGNWKYTFESDEGGD